MRLLCLTPMAAFAGAAPLSIKPKAWTCSDSRANL